VAEVVRVRVWRWLAAAAVWLLAVAVVAAVVWFAIDSAGREVAGADEAVTLVSAPQTSPGLATPSRDAARTPRPSSPSSTLLGADRPESGTEPLTSSGTPSVPGSGGGRTGTYGSTGGDLVVRCLDDTVDGWALRAADGWRAEAALDGGGLRVLFVGGDGRMVGLQAACQNGEPSFSLARQQPARS
jgi:hypothetical protein